MNITERLEGGNLHLHTTMGFRSPSGFRKHQFSQQTSPKFMKTKKVS